MIPMTPESLKLFEQAINADSTYFEPQIYKFLYYYNLEQYAIADSLLQRLLAKSGTHYRQQILLNEYEALLDGNLKSATMLPHIFRASPVRHPLAIFFSLGMILLPTISAVSNLI